MKKRNFFCLSGSLIVVASLLLGASQSVDPTRPPGYEQPDVTTETEQPLRLTAIFIYPTYRLAIINNKPAKVGDKINEYTITSIYPNTVELTGPEDTQAVLQVIQAVKHRRS